MNILFIGPLPPPVTGQSIACQLLLDHLKTVAEVSFINLSKRTFQQGVSSIHRVIEVLNIIIKSLLRVRSANVIYFTISESNAGNLKDLLLYACCWGRLDKMIAHLHGGAGMKEVMSGSNLFRSKINAFFLRRLGAVIVLGDRLRPIFEGIVEESKLHSIPNFANDIFFVPVNYLEKKFASTQPLRILFLSNLLPGKGYIELLTALAELPIEQRRRLRVDFAGGFETVSDELYFREEVKVVEGLDVEIHGIVQGEKKRQLLEKAHLFCLPTYYPYEGQPISILEAYASGCAVMTTDHSGIFDTFTPGVNGLEVKARSPDSIKEALLHAFSNPQELYQFAKTNRMDAENKYRSSIHLDALAKIFSNVG